MLKRRLQISLAIALVFLTIALLPRAWATMQTDPPDRYSLYVVKKGDTLWWISKRYMPKVDPRVGVTWIRRANYMPESYIIQPGDLLNVPDEDGELEEPLGPEYLSEEAARKAEEAVNRLLGLSHREETKPVSRAGPPAREMVMEATAYTQRLEEGTADGITATGTQVRPGVIAVDPNVIPLNSWVYIESNYPFVSGFYHTEDIGGAIKGQRVDIYMTDLGRAMDFGKRQVRVEVIE